jgi:hypothetical protein
MAASRITSPGRGRVPPGLRPSSLPAARRLAGAPVMRLAPVAGPSRPTAPPVRPSKPAQARPERTPPPANADATTGETAVGVARTPVRAARAAPTSPRDDPAYQAAIAQLGRTRNAQKKHPEPEEKKQEVKGAALLPTNQQKETNDRKAHLETLDQISSQEKGAKRFNPQMFKNLLNEELTKLEGQLPHSEAGADRFKEEKPLEAVREGISGRVNAENQKVAAPITEQTTQPLPPDSKIEPQVPGSLRQSPPGSRPASINPASVAPKPRQDAEISMEGEIRRLDGVMAENKLTEEQLSQSNEPEFEAALGKKKEAQAKAREVPVQYRARESSTLARAGNAAQSSARRNLDSMHGERRQAFAGVYVMQVVTKTADVIEQGRVKAELARIYDDTKKAVNKIFDDLTTNESSPTNVNKLFADRSTAAKSLFEERVEEQLDDIHGLGIQDALFGEDTEAIEGVFTREKATFLSTMDVLLDEIAVIIANQLNAAVERIAQGNRESETFFGSLSARQQKLAGDAMDTYRAQYKDLEASVDDKQAELVSGLAASYKENVDTLRATFDKLEEEASKNFLEKAVDFVVGVAKAVYNLGKLLYSIVTRIAGIIDEILAHPIRFLENLGAGIKRGFDTFAGNFDAYLLKGFFDWLRGSMSGTNVEVPARLDERGLFGLAMQLVGLSYQTFRETVIRKLGAPGERILGVLERGEEMLGEATKLFAVLKSEGIGGLWDHLKVMLLSHLNEVFERVKQAVLYETIKRVLIFVATMFNPIGAFIRAVQALYAGLRFLIDNIGRIATLVNAFLDSLDLAVKGDVSGIASKVITALSAFIVMAIDFLAKLLNLGNLADKVRKVIQALRNPVIRAMEWLVDRLIRPLVSAAQRGVKAVGSGVQAIREWWRARKAFKAANGAQHTLLFRGEGRDASLIVQSVDAPLSNYIGRIRQSGIAVPQRVTDIQEEIFDLRTRYVPEPAGDQGSGEDAKRPRTRGRRAHPSEDSGKRIAALLNELGEELKKLPDPDRPGQNLYMPPSRIVERKSWPTSAAAAGLSGGSEDGQYVEVRPLSIRPGSLHGSQAGYRSPLFRAVEPRGVYDRGHLLGAHLYGPGDANGGKWNLTPITVPANRSMTSVENKIHGLVFTQNKVVSLKVTVGYPQSPSVPAGAPIKAEHFLPTTIRYDLRLMEPKANPSTNADEVNRARELPDGWVEGTPVPIAEIRSNPPLATALDVESLNVATGKTIREKSGASARFAEALVNLASRRQFRNKQDFLDTMADAATTKVLKLDDRYDPTQESIDENAARVAAKIGDDLRWT